MATDDEPPEPANDAAAPPAVDGEDVRVREFIDAATRAELERWFGLPSFDQATAPGAPEPESVDPDVLRIRENRARAIAAVDPGLLARVEQRFTSEPSELTRLPPELVLRTDPSIAKFDVAMAERLALIAAPREVEITEELRDDLRECTPQAILRDLHRPELDFTKQFEMIDHAADQRLDIVAEVATAMRTSWKLTLDTTSPFAAAAAEMADVRVRRWRDMRENLHTLPNRNVEE